MTAVLGFQFGMAGISGQLLCGRQFQNSLADSSLEEIKRAIQDEPWLMDYYEIGETFVRSRDRRIEYTFAGLERNINSIKSKGRILLCWVDEAEGVSDTAWSILIPTLREEGEDWHAELWVTWNPARKGSATDKRFRQTIDPRIKVVEINWRDNPKFPALLERQRRRDLEERPDTYDWIWEGAYATVVSGAYFAKSLTAAKAAGRISRVAPDPLMRLRAFTDIGGTGKKADSFVWWIAQFIGREIRVLDHYETQGQPLEAHLNWARGKGYTPDKMDIWLPHDGVTHDKVFDVSYESALTRAGYTVEVVPNQGPGAAIARIEAARRMFPAIWFNAETTEAGRDALGFYHEKRDEVRDVGLGPEHDWSSHSCLTGDTLVATNRGNIRIDQVVAGDRVLTPAGYARVTRSWCVGIAETLVETTTTDGRTLRSTPDHLIFTTGGLIRADAVSHNDRVITRESAPCLCQANAKLTGYRTAFIENFKGSSIGSGQSADSIALSETELHHSCTASCSLQTTAETPSLATMSFQSTATGSASARRIGGYSDEAPTDRAFKNTSRFGIAAFCTTRNLTAISKRVATKVANFYIGQYGKLKSVQSLPGITFITLTATKLTTGWRIWSARLQANTSSIMQSKAIGSAATPICCNSLKVEARPQIGTDPRKVGRGTSDTQLKSGPIGSQSQRHASLAIVHTEPITQTRQNSVPEAASKKTYTGVSEPVYDLTVEHHHCFFANGMLVSNCDAFGMMAIVAEDGLRSSSPQGALLRRRRTGMAI